MQSSSERGNKEAQCLPCPMRADLPTLSQAAGASEEGMRSQGRWNWGAQIQKDAQTTTIFSRTRVAQRCDR